jgi:hypothetical protein
MDLHMTIRFRINADAAEYSDIPEKIRLRAVENQNRYWFE